MGLYIFYFVHLFYFTIKIIILYIYLLVTANLTLYLNNAFLLLSFIIIICLLFIEFIILNLLSLSVILLLLYISAIIPIILLWVFIARSSMFIIGSYSISWIMIIIIGVGQIMNIIFLFPHHYILNWLLLISPVSFNYYYILSSINSSIVLNCGVILYWIIYNISCFGFFISTICYYYYIHFYYYSISISWYFDIIDSFGIYCFDSYIIIMFWFIFAATMMILIFLFNIHESNIRNSFVKIRYHN